MNLAMSLLLSLYLLVVVSAPLAWGVVCLVRWARRRRQRRQVLVALAECVSEARELGRAAAEAQAVHVNYVFALHRERREGVKARA